MISYPNGKSFQKTIKPESDKKVDYSRRGMSLEDDLNATNKYYLAVDKAAVYKKPTPINIVHVDYKSRQTAKITEAYFQVPSTTDYNGVYNGLYLDFEAKETHSKTSLVLEMIHPHQIEHLRRVIKYKGFAFLIVRFAMYDETYFIKADKFLDHIDNTTARSVKLQWFKDNGILIPYSYNVPVDYLKVIDKLLMEEK